VGPSAYDPDSQVREASVDSPMLADRSTQQVQAATARWASGALCSRIASHKDVAA